MTGTDVEGLLQVLTGYQGAAVVAAACRTGLMDALAATSASASASADALAARAGTAPGPTRSLLEALAGLGLVVVTNDGAGTARYAAAELVGRLRSGGDLRAVVDKEAFFARLWNGLDTTLRTGGPLLSPWRARLVNEPDVARRFLEALVTLAREIGPDLSLLPELGRDRRVVDVGGGLGSYAVPLALAGAAMTLVELPTVAGWARERLAGSVVGAQVGGRQVDVVAADALTEPACGVGPGSADAVLLAHVLHDLDDDDARTLLTRAGEALRPGGAVVVVEIPGEGPYGSLFDLMMRVETPGRARTAAELHALLREAAMVDVRDAPYPRPVLVTVGRRA